MLSIISKNHVSAKSMQAAISSINGNELKNKNAIRKATVVAAGFNSVEQAKALLDRNKMIDESLWVERQCSSNHWQVLAGNLTICIANGEITIYEGNKSEVTSRFSLGHSSSFIDSEITAADIAYHKDKQVSIVSPKNNRELIIIERDNQSVSFKYFTSSVNPACHVLSLIKNFTLNEYKASIDTLKNPKVMLSFFLKEFIDSSPCMPWEVFSEDLGLNKIEINQIKDTAKWLVQFNRGNLKAAKEIEPIKKNILGVGALAYMVLSKVTCKGNNIRETVRKSMHNIGDHTLDELTEMARNEYDLFHLFYV